MGKAHFILNGKSYDKRALLGRMCKYGVARWGLDETLQIARLEAEIIELRTLCEHLTKAVKARRKRIAELKRQSPTLQQKRWDDLRVARAVFFLTSETSLEGAAQLLGVSRETLTHTLAASIKLLKRREAEAVAGEDVVSETLDDALFYITEREGFGFGDVEAGDFETGDFEGAALDEEF